jgi:glutathione S-transferase
MYFTALITIASLLFYLSLGLAVAKARVRYGVKAPATTGDETFERFFRVQMNTLEWLPIYIPCLWLFGFYVSDLGAAALGLVWIIGRYIYKNAYVAAPPTRSLGFAVQATATAVLMVGVVFDIVYRFALGY